MPLRDHFHPPLSDRTIWEGLHGQWPAMIVLDLSKRLPPRYVALPAFTWGPPSKSTSPRPMPNRNRRQTGAAGSNGRRGDRGLGPAAADAGGRDRTPGAGRIRGAGLRDRARRLVAAVEIVSPANKDRPEHRRAFVAKCAALLQQGVSVSVVDLVTTRRSNLYGDLLDLLGQTDPSLAPARHRSMPSPAAGGRRAGAGGWRHGPMPWPSASPCRPFRCGSPPIWRYRWSWRRATRRRAASCGSGDREDAVAGRVVASGEFAQLTSSSASGALNTAFPALLTVQRIRRRRTPCPANPPLSSRSSGPARAVRDLGLNPVEEPGRPVGRERAGPAPSAPPALAEERLGTR